MFIDAGVCVCLSGCVCVCVCVCSVCLREVRSADAASFSAQCEAANSVERFVSALLLARYTTMHCTVQYRQHPPCPILP